MKVAACCVLSSMGRMGVGFRFAARVASTNMFLLAEKRQQGNKKALKALQAAAADDDESADEVGQPSAAGLYDFVEWLFILM